jgi:hypothetical protein
MRSACFDCLGERGCVTWGTSHTGVGDRRLVSAILVRGRPVDVGDFSSECEQDAGDAADALGRGRRVEARKPLAQHGNAEAA